MRGLHGGIRQFGPAALRRSQRTTLGSSDRAGVLPRSPSEPSLLNGLRLLETRPISTLTAALTDHNTVQRDTCKIAATSSTFNKPSIRLTVLPWVQCSASPESREWGLRSGRQGPGWRSVLRHIPGPVRPERGHQRPSAQPPGRRSRPTAAPHARRWPDRPCAHAASCRTSHGKPGPGGHRSRDAPGHAPSTDDSGPESDPGRGGSG
jgi:hypothetical protein